MPPRRKPIHPGEVLNEEFLKPLGLTGHRLAKRTGMPPDRVDQLVGGARSVNTETALRLGRFLGTTPAFWMNLQARYDLEVASDRQR